MTKIRIIDRWIEARRDLGLDVVGPIDVKISDSLTVQADILVKNFGGPNGTIGVERGAHLRGVAGDIWEAGYGLSEFGPPGENSFYDRESTIECLRDWGWSGPAHLKPKWLDGIRIVIAYDGERFCAELSRDEKYLGRICEIQLSDEYSVEIEPQMDREELGASIEDAKALLQKNKLGST